MPARSRRGLSLLDVVVILLCVVLLLALVLPAINVGRRHPRRSQCLNNMRNVGLAIQNFASQNGGRLPTLHGEDGDGVGADQFQSWPRQLLPALDQPALHREIYALELDTAPAGQVAAYIAARGAAPTLQVLTCPDDGDSFQQPGGLSYVVNAGYGFFPVDHKTGVVAEKGRHSFAQDWDDDGQVSGQDQLVTKATGAFWRPDETGERMTLNFIGMNDGTGSTLLLTENLHAGPWTSRDARALAFVIGRERLTFDRAAGPLAVTKADLGPFAINGAKDAKGLVPGPSSNHAGSVTVIWADGRGGGISENMDPLVYVRVLTTAGTLYGEQPVDDRAVQ